MTEALPEPLVPPEADMRGLPFMPLDVVRLMDSDLFALSTGDEFKAAVAAWCKSWLQLPAGSLPDDDRVLAHLTGAGSRWRKIKAMALHGFVKCSDGRFYHPVVCEKVLEGMERRAQYAEDREADRERLKRWRDAKRNKRETRFGNADETDVKRVSEPFRNANETAGETEVKRLRQGQGQGQGQGEEGRITPLVQKPQSVARAHGAPPSYAFGGAIIRLTQADFDQWKASYFAIPDMRAELTTIDAKLVDEGFEGKWFGRVGGWLRTRHEELLKRRNGEDEAYRGVI